MNPLNVQYVLCLPPGGGQECISKIQHMQHMVVVQRRGPGGGRERALRQQINKEGGLWQRGAIRAPSLSTVRPSRRWAVVEPEP